MFLPQMLAIWLLPHLAMVRLGFSGAPACWLRGGMQVMLSPGLQVRFRVEEGDKAGSSWSIQTVKGKGDVYAIHREGGRQLKTSFHESGQWHFSVMPKGRARLGERESAYLGVVKEHEEIAPGWLHAMRITVPRSELRDGYEEQVRQRVVVNVPVDPEMDAVSIDLLLGDENAAPLRVDHAFLIAHMKRGDGGQALILARPMLLGESLHVGMSAQISEIRRGLRDQGWDGTSPTRAVIIGYDETRGFHRQIEIAIDPDSV